MKTKPRPLPTLDEIITPKAWHQCRCPVHVVPLIRTDTGWVCARGLNCTGLIGDLTLWSRIEPHLKTRGNKKQLIRQQNAVWREIKRRSKEFHNQEVQASAPLYFT